MGKTRDYDNIIPLLEKDNPDIPQIEAIVNSWKNLLDELHPEVEVLADALYDPEEQFEILIDRLEKIKNHMHEYTAEYEREDIEEELATELARKNFAKQREANESRPWWKRLRGSQVEFKPKKVTPHMINKRIETYRSAAIQDIQVILKELHEVSEALDKIDKIRKRYRI